MYFDPLSAWLVSLIADGIIIAGEKSNSGAGAEFNQKCIEDYNKYLNADIRRIKSKFMIYLVCLDCSVQALLVWEKSP